MTKKMIRYTVKPERAIENESLVAKVFEELKHGEPAGLRYATFKLDDGVTFIHVVSYESEEASNALANLPAFKTFRIDIADRCEIQPVTEELNEVDSYRFFNPSN